MTRVEASSGRLPARSDKAHIALPSAPVSCRLAREFVLSVTGGAEDPRVALVVTELVTNAVVHGHARPQLRVGWDGRTLQVEVQDDGPGLPTLRPLDPTTTSGRGLALVDQIADDWGVAPPADDGANGDAGRASAHPDGAPDPDAAEQGKVVWARIDLDR